jgi:hypothetical protein
MSEVKEKSGITLQALNEGKALEVHVSGTLDKGDYEHFIPAVEKLIQQHGKIRLLVEMHGFHGWTAGALWQDIKFDARHYRDFERIAMVGETKWQHGMSVVCRPFTTANIRYFDHAALEEARTWLQAA